MKKLASKIILSALVLTLASEPLSMAYSESNLPYIEDLGYEVEVVEEGIGRQATASKIYDSGWKNLLGGRWRHGVSYTHVWSNYDHSSKYHKTTVREAGGKYSSSGWVSRGRRASASWEKSRIGGNRAWVDVK